MIDWLTPFDMVCFIFYNLLQKPASWLVAVCERNDNRGCGGERLTKQYQISFSGRGKGGRIERFAGLCTIRQLADGGVSIPPRSAIVVAEYGRMI